jgi:rhodanese-related sulfurtransferase
MRWFGTSSISVHDAALRVDGGAVLLDVRTKSEWKEIRADRSTHISLDSLHNRWGKLAGEEVLVICRSGRRSATAARFLRHQGVDATNVKGGMLAWRRAGLPSVESRARGRR